MNGPWRRRRVIRGFAIGCLIVMAVLVVIPLAVARDDIDIDSAAAQYGVAPELLRAVCTVESSWRADAIGDDGESIGLCQIQIDTGLTLQGRRWKHDLTPTERRVAMRQLLLSPTVNIHLAAKLLRQHLDRFGGDETLAVAAYNGGPNHKLIRYVLKVRSTKTRPAGGVANKHPQRLTVRAAGTLPPPVKTPSAARDAALLSEQWQ